MEQMRTVLGAARQISDVKRIHGPHCLETDSEQDIGSDRELHGTRSKERARGRQLARTYLLSVAHFAAPFKPAGSAILRLDKLAARVVIRHVAGHASLADLIMSRDLPLEVTEILIQALGEKTVNDVFQKAE